MKNLRAILLTAAIVAVFFWLNSAKSDHAVQSRCIEPAEIRKDVEAGVLNHMHSLDDVTQSWRAVGRMEGRAAKDYATEEGSPHAHWEWDMLITFDSTGRYYAFVMFHEDAGRFCYTAHAVRSKWGSG